MNRTLRRAAIVLEWAVNARGIAEDGIVDAARLALAGPPFAKKPKPAPKRLPERSRKEAREAKRARHAEETAELRARAVERSRGRCEACGEPFVWAGTPELDHLESGSGRRRQLQAIGTVWLLCRPCHRFRTDRPLAQRWTEAVQAWATKHGYPIPRRYR